MGELLPITCGIALGSIVAFTRQERRPVAVLLVMVFLAALAATVSSGEYRITWAYLLVDAALVVLAAAATFVLAWRVGWAR